MTLLIPPGQRTASHFHPQFRQALVSPFLDPNSPVRQYSIPSRLPTDAVQICFGKTQGTDADYRVRVQTFIDTQSRRLQQCYVTWMKAESQLLRQPSPENNVHLQQAYKKYHTFYRNPHTYQQLCKLIEASGFSNLPLTARRTLEVFKKRFDQARPLSSVDPEEYYRLEDDIVADTKNLQTFLNTTARDNEEFASEVPDGYDKPYGEVAEDLLGKLNKAAQMQGFRNYGEKALAKDGLDERLVRQTIQVIKSWMKTANNRIEYIHGQLRAEECGWTHLKGKSAQEVSAYHKSVFNNNPEKKAERDRSRAFLQQNKLRHRAWWAVHNRVNEQGLVRVLTEMAIMMGWQPERLAGINYLESNETQRAWVAPINPPDEAHFTIHPWASDETRFHEAGHALDVISADPNIPFPLRLADSYVGKEGVGQLFASIPMHPAWQIDDMSTLNPAERRRFAQLNYLNNFESLYQKLGELVEWAEDELKLFQDVNKHKNLAIETPVHITNPGSGLTYLMSHVWAANVMRYMSQEFGGLLSPEAGAYLRQHFANGQLLPWQEELKRMTGKSKEQPAMTPQDLPDFLEANLKALEDSLPKPEKNSKKLAP